MNYSATHEEIINGCKRGDRHAQFELYKLYSKAMYNICLRMLKNENDAEDMLQNSFMDVYTKLDTFQYQSSIGAWMKRIVINNCINFLTKNRLKLEELADKHNFILEEEHDVPDIPDYTLSIEKINKAIPLLPDGYRVVLNLYLFEGYDHQEIGEILNISEATSKSQYSRARKKLKELIVEKY